uniref:Retrovirus-related Env polyprotein from transposon gypsy n=1 Tax=Bactrocera latifrons TaxID=174628 RepID=A0A0K8V751_BACLA
MTNLSKILTPYYKIAEHKGEMPSEDATETALFNRIEILRKQLLNNGRARRSRSLDFLGSILKFITGVPDHVDLIEIKTILNDIIENNNKQRQINSNFEIMMKTFNIKTIKQKVVLQELYQKLFDLTMTINFAKNGNFYSAAINTDEIERILGKGQTSIPVIDILEYADTHVGRLDDTFIVIYKYPVIEKKCTTYKVTPLSYRQGILDMNKIVSKCGDKIILASKCKSNLSKYICKQEPNDNCTIPMIKGYEAHCNVIQENNAPIIDLGHGNVVLQGKHILNGKSIEGSNLIQFNETIIIDSEVFHNQEQEIKNYIIANGNERIHILEILKSENEYQFDNIKKLNKFLIPFEEHPIKNMFITIGVLVVLGLSIFVIFKLYIIYQTTVYLRNYNATIERVGMTHLLKTQV